MLPKWKRLYLAHDPWRAKGQAKKHILNLVKVAKRPYIAFSGGKDSLVLLILCSELGLTNIPVFTQGDDLDYDFKEDYCKRVVKYLGFNDYSYIKSKVSALDQLRKIDLSTDDSITGVFSHVYKEFAENRQLDGSIVGLRIEESKKRKKLILGRTELFQNKHSIWQCNPIARMSGVDVFSIITQSDVEYIEVYDKDTETIPPHEIRFSWSFSPQFASSGSALFLKLNYPAQFAKLCTINPKIRGYV